MTPRPEPARTSDHRLRIDRYSRGRSVESGGTSYGTRGRCSCREWEERRNVAPSLGGRTQIKRLHAIHVAEVAAGAGGEVPFTVYEDILRRILTAVPELSSDPDGLVVQAATRVSFSPAEVQVVRDIRASEG